MLFVDLTFLPIVEKLRDQLKSVEKIVVLTDAAHMPETKLDAEPYEEWLAADSDFAWREFDETTAAGMCYTSGTTGNPKGVVYSHRSNVLHRDGGAGFGRVRDCLAATSCLPIVPMFHANCWSLAFSAPMSGASLVMPGPKLDGASVYELLDTCKSHDHGGGADDLDDAASASRGEQSHAAASEARPDRRLGLSAHRCWRSFRTITACRVMHAWGMTEMSPIGTCGSMKPEVEALEREARIDMQEKQGFSMFGVEMKITDDEGRELPWDGKTFGRLKVRGAGGRASVLQGRGQAKSSMTTGTSIPATSPTSTSTAT